VMGITRIRDNWAGVLFVKHQTRDVENDVRDKGTSGGRILQLGASWRSTRGFFRAS